MTEILDLLKGQLSKMNVDGSWVFGAVSGGLTIAIPQWIYKKGWSMNHSYLDRYSNWRDWDGVANRRKSG